MTRFKLALKSSNKFSLFTVIGPIPWGHSGPLCYALSLIVVVVVDIEAQAACSDIW